VPDARVGGGGRGHRLEEILDAWFAGEPSDASDDVANIRHVDEIG
jgi:hypothetical protein